MGRRQLAVLGLVAVLALLFVMVDSYLTRSDEPAPVVEMTDDGTFVDDDFPAASSDSCVECHGDEFEFEGPIPDIDEHGYVYDQRDLEQSGQGKPP